jgi:hypothetical protein
MKWTGYIARVEERRGLCGILVGRPEGGDHLGDPGVDGRIILKWVCKTWGGGMNWINVSQDRDR